MSTLVEQLFMRWEQAESRRCDVARGLEVAERALEEARCAEDAAAVLLHKALGDRRVLIGNRVVWTMDERDGDGFDISVRYTTVFTPEQVEPVKVGMD